MLWNIFLVFCHEFQAFMHLRFVGFVSQTELLVCCGVSKNPLAILNLTIEKKLLLEFINHLLDVDQLEFNLSHPSRSGKLEGRSE